MEEQAAYNLKYVIDNFHIVKKIPQYHHEIKYLLKQSKDSFVYVSPEIIKLYFIPIINVCLELEKNDVPSYEWLGNIEKKLLLSNNKW